MLARRLTTVLGVTVAGLLFTAGNAFAASSWS